jgi:hypothetical protein
MIVVGLRSAEADLISAALRRCAHSWQWLRGQEQEAFREVAVHVICREC